MADKKFGLIIPKKVDKLKMRTKSIFDDDSDEEEKQCKRPKIPQKKMDMKKKLKEESLEDPSIYEYDSIYDDMKAKEAESIAPKEKKNSRYIDTLLKAADKRKKEYERRIDKKIQLEREKEGDIYKDKEAFVTSSYKKKLQEKEEEEERERRENMLNDMMDITKQKDLSGFYRHFLKQTVGEEKVPAFGEKFIKKEVSSNEESNSPGKVVENSKDINFEDLNVDQDSDGVEIDSDDNKDIYLSGETTSKKHAIATTSQKCSDKEEKAWKNKSNKYVLRDNSKLSEKEKHSKAYSKRDSSSSSSDSDTNSSEDVNYTKKVSQSDAIESSETNIQRPRHDSSSSDDEVIKKSDNIKEQDKFVKKDRKSIYEKRTVGDAFIAAQTRYFQRMALKNEK